MAKFKDLTGQRFGRLVVIKQTEHIRTKSGISKVRWICECDCGNKNYIVRSDYLLSGRVVSCGCYNKERIIKFNKNNKAKYNKYDLTGEYGIGYTSNTNEPFYFDLEDYDLIKDYCWYAIQRERDKVPYIEARYKNEEIDKHIRIHRLIMNPSDDEQVDHIDRNPFNNRKENLRICSNQQNSWNKGLRICNSSGYIGIRKEQDKWFARITYDNKQIVLGKFDNIEDAIKARLKAEKEYFGEFAPQKHLFKEYAIE